MRPRLDHNRPRPRDSRRLHAEPTLRPRMQADPPCGQLCRPDRFSLMDPRHGR